MYVRSIYLLTKLNRGGGGGGGGGGGEGAVKGATPRSGDKFSIETWERGPISSSPVMG